MIDDMPARVAPQLRAGTKARPPDASPRRRPATLPWCDWCERRRVERRGARYCSHTCRQRAYERRREINRSLDRAARALASCAEELRYLQKIARPRHAGGPGIPGGVGE